MNIVSSEDFAFAGKSCFHNNVSSIVGTEWFLYREENGNMLYCNVVEKYKFY
jgi:hypothetical protein